MDAALDLMPSLDRERKSLQANAQRLRAALSDHQISTAG